MLLENNDLMLSVLVLTFNQEEFIEQTLYSILNQKHSYRYEIVVADDCSTDNTRDIVRRIQREYPDIIKAIYNEYNLGVILNFYNAISYCKGKYIMDCGGDDYFLPNKVYRQINYLETNKDVGLLCGYAKIYNEKSHKFEKHLLGSPDVQYMDFMKENAICASTVCYRRELLDQYIEQVNPIQHNWLMEDYPMWIWFSINSKIYFDDYQYVVYRFVKNSISHASDVKRKLKFERNAFEIVWYYTNNDTLRKSIKNNYYRRIADILYNYRYFDNAIYFIKKCDYTYLDYKTKVKYYCATIPIIREVARFVYVRIFKEFCF